jgi:simple sugar transport system ATP-binding protein
MPKRDASLAEAETVRSNVCMPDVSPDHRRTGLHLAGISKSYGATRVVCDVDLSVDRGEVVALMGANGAGKSTLAKIASGVVQPDSGHILVAGHAVKLAGPQGARSHGIFIVHQSTDQLGVPGLSVAENLVLDELCNGKIGRFTNRRMIRLRAQAIAANVGLDLPLDRDYGELGPGHRQLIAVARAVATKASILIFDEPTASLGASEAARLFAVIDRLRTSGVGILYISHRLADLRRIADRLVILRNGQIVTQQARPLDFRLAIQTMIGRDLQGATVNRSDSLAGQTVLDLRGVQLTRNAKPFDLSLRAGEIVAIAGAVGSGKSRLLGAPFGLSRIAAGEIRLHGTRWQPKGPGEAIRNGVFMAGEDRWHSSLLSPATLGGNIAGTIALPHRPHWFPFGFVRRAKEQSAASKAITALGIRCGSSDDTMDLLSGGNQQKVVVGRWQAEPCHLLLLDEPFQGIDVGARRDLIASIRSARGGSATLIATSDIEEAIEVADVVVVIRNHTIVGRHEVQFGDPTSLLNAIAAVEGAQIEATERFAA